MYPIKLKMNHRPQVYSPADGYRWRIADDGTAVHEPNPSVRPVVTVYGAVKMEYDAKQVEVVFKPDTEAAKNGEHIVEVQGVATEGKPLDYFYAAQVKANEIKQQDIAGAAKPGPLPRLDAVSPDAHTVGPFFWEWREGFALEPKWVLWRGGHFHGSWIKRDQLLGLYDTEQQVKECLTFHLHVPHETLLS